MLVVTEKVRFAIQERCLFYFTNSMDRSQLYHCYSQGNRFLSHVPLPVEAAVKKEAQVGCWEEELLRPAGRVQNRTLYLRNF